MAVDLPTQFFYQDYHHEASSLSKKKSKNTTSSSWSCFGSSESGSVLNSPIESELGSTETESEDSEEDYMAELSRQMAHYMLEDDNNHDHHHHHHHKQEKASWSPSAASPPLSTFWPPLGSTPESPKFQSKQSLIDDQIRAIQYYKLNLKQDQPMKKYQNKKKANINDPQSSNPMKAVFLEGSGSKTKSSSGGTGVFLPKKNGHASESRKKQGCSTVLIPARVVQALKQHFDKVGVPSRFSGNFPLQNDGLLGSKNNSSLNSQQQRPAPVSNHQEIALPQEWTY